MIKKNIILILVIVAVLAIICLSLLLVMKESTPTPNEDGHIITHFSLSESSSNAMAEYGDEKSYCFSLEENTLEIENTELGDEIEIELDKEEREKLEQELLTLIETYSLRKWNGYDEWLDVLDDFHGFTFEVEFSDNKEIYATGDHMFPDKYREVFKAVESVFYSVYK